jgi:aromatic ring-cleaving dioxygenase
MRSLTPIPTVLRIDIEPDEFQPEVGQKPWQGFVSMATLTEELRERLASRSGHAFHPTWFLRLDPDIERCFGRVDFVVHRHSNLFDRLVAHKDPLGIHVHPHRWDEKRSVAFSDHADNAWTTYCLTVAAEAFAHCFGEPVRRSSQGGYFLTETILDAAIAAGIKVDVTAEPGLAPKTADPSFGAYATAPSGDFRDCPRRPYYPSRDRFAVPSSSFADARPILIVPLTAYDYLTALQSWPRRFAKRLLGIRRPHFPLNPWKVWPSPKIYWDLVAQAADDQPACYFALAIRTDTPGSVTHERYRQLLEYLPNHPVAERLRFVDPLGPEIRALATPSAE